MIVSFKCDLYSTPMKIYFQYCFRKKKNFFRPSVTVYWHPRNPLAAPAQRRFAEAFAQMSIVAVFAFRYCSLKSDVLLL